jgi:hypothetical protein
MTEQEQVQVTQADRDAAEALYGNPAYALGFYDHTPFVQAFARHRHTATAEALEAMREAQHMASDLLQHIDWLTNGLPAMLENGGLTDEEGLIGAAVDAKNSGRTALTRLTAALRAIAETEGQQS